MFRVGTEREKPTPWAFDRGLIRGEWDWFWDNCLCAYPIWDQSALGVDLGPYKAHYTFDGGTSMVRYRYGPEVDMALNGTTVTAVPLGKSFAQPCAIWCVMHYEADFGSGAREMFEINTAALPTIRKISLGIDLNGNIAYDMRRGTTVVEDVSTYTLTLGEIATVVFVSYSTTDHKLYINGALDTSDTTDSGSVSQWDQVQFHSGKGPNPVIACGAWSFAPSVGQIKQFSDNPFGPFRPRLIGHNLRVPAGNTFSETITANYGLSFLSEDTNTAVETISTNYSLSSAEINLAVLAESIRSEYALSLTETETNTATESIVTDLAYSIQSTNNITASESITLAYAVTQSIIAGLNLSETINMAIAYGVSAETAVEVLAGDGYTRIFRRRRR